MEKITYSFLPSWFLLAQKEIGVKEAPGYANNPVVQQYYEDAGSGKQPDSVPWCAAFVGAMLERSGWRGTGLLAARSYLNWGEKLKKPIDGCIVILKRGNSSWQGHVGFYYKGKLLGGNQKDMVSIAPYNKGSVLGYRWPKTQKSKITTLYRSADMNAKQIGDAFRAMLIAVFGAGAGISWITDEMYLAIGSAVLAVGIGIWQLVSSSIWKLLDTVEKDPVVVKVVVADDELADELGPKVEAVK